MRGVWKTRKTATTRISQNKICQYGKAIAIDKFVNQYKNQF